MVQEKEKKEEKEKIPQSPLINSRRLTLPRHHDWASFLADLLLDRHGGPLGPDPRSHFLGRKLMWLVPAALPQVELGERREPAGRERFQIV
jgi:hypothetical protein